MKKYDSYKNSGIEWYGNIPKHWSITRLKFLGDAIGGVTYSPKDIVEDPSKGVLVLRSSNIQNGKLDLSDTVYINQSISKKLTLRDGDILICSRNGSRRLIGKNICIDERTSGHTFGAFMMIFRSTYFKWLSQYFNSPIFKSQSGLFLTSTINQLTSGTLNNFEIALPPSIEEQTQIANYLDKKTTEIDSLIENKEKLITLLKEERTAVINQAVTKGLDPNVPMKDSGIEWLGEIPEHWEVSRISFLTSRVGDGLHGTPKYVEESLYPFINGSNIDDGEIIITERTKFVSQEEYSKNKKVLTSNTILMSINGTIGNLAFYNGETIMLGKSAAYINLEPNVNKEFVYYFLKSSAASDYINKELSGSTIKNLSLNSIDKTPIPYPKEKEQKLIVSKIKNETLRIDEILLKSEQEIELLKEYKTALISEVVTGKVDVRNKKLD